MSFQTVTMTLLDGFLLNIELFAVTLVLSLPLGLVVSFGTMSRFKPLSLLVRLYVYIMRSTPLMLQLAVVFYLPGIVFGPGHSLGRMGAAVLAFVLNYAAYFSEIFRGGIQGVPAGQREAGQVLGMTRSQIFFQVTLLQVVKRIVPPMGNEIITLVKDTSLSNFIMVGEIIKLAKDFGNKGMIWPLFYAGAFFLVFNGSVTLALSPQHGDFTGRGYPEAIRQDAGSGGYQLFPGAGAGHGHHRLLRLRQDHPPALPQLPGASRPGPHHRGRRGAL